MIEGNHENHVVNALKAIKDCGKVDHEGRVSYQINREYPGAWLILQTLISPKGASPSQSSLCLNRSLNAYLVDGCRGISRFRELYAAEMRKLKIRDLQHYEVVRSCYSQIPVNLKPRRLLGAFIRTGTIQSFNDASTSMTLPEHVVRAVNSRSAIAEMADGKEYLPAYKEGNLVLAAKSLAPSVADAKDDGENALSSYLALLNFVTGFGQGNSWDVNPLQPQGVVIPSAYITVHDRRGRLLDGSVYYEAGLSLVRTTGKSVSKDRARKIDDQMDFVIKRLDRHFDKQMLWEAIRLLGESYSGTEQSNVFLKCWMVLERLMYFGSSESHEAMLKRMRFILNSDLEQIEKGVLESLRLTRNHIAHQGLGIREDIRLFWDSPLSALLKFVNRLLHFHLHLPKGITNKDDFLQFTLLPLDIDALKRKDLLTKLMLDRIEVVSGKVH